MTLEVKGRVPIFSVVHSMMEEARMKGDLAATDKGKYCGMAVLSICEALMLAINDQSNKT
ncbi:MAG: hypothetical protein ACKVKF_05190 [Rhodobacterales bacterium]|nr:hypothetical protein [Puniceibacterium antarcticum]